MLLIGAEAAVKVYPLRDPKPANLNTTLNKKHASFEMRAKPGTGGPSVGDSGLDETVDMLEMFEKHLKTYFSVFSERVSRMPGGCRHQETSGNQVLDKFYRRVFYIFQYFVILLLDN